MRPKARHNHRPTIPVIPRIVNVLHTRSKVDSAPDVSGVIGFDDILPPILQSAIAKEEAFSAVREIDLMVFLDAVRDEGNAGAILLAMP
jgi:hypothetical protein